MIEDVSWKTMESRHLGAVQVQRLLEILPMLKIVPSNQSKKDLKFVLEDNEY